MKLEIITLAVIGAFLALFAYTSLTGVHDWGGADDQPEGVIQKLTGGGFKPWFQNVWTPPSSEIESLLFALQAAVGSIIIGYFLGYYRGRALGAREKDAKAKAKKAASTEQKGIEKGDGEPDAQPAR